MHSVDRALMPIRPGERFPVQEKAQPVACRAAALRLRPLICNRLFRLGVVQEIAAGGEPFPVPADPADNEYRNGRMRFAQRVDGARQRIADSGASGIGLIVEHEKRRGSHRRDRGDHLRFAFAASGEAEVQERTVEHPAQHGRKCAARPGRTASLRDGGAVNDDRSRIAPGSGRLKHGAFVQSDRQ